MGSRFGVRFAASALAVGCLLGLLAGSFATLGAQKAREQEVYDKHGKALHVGDVIRIDGFKVPIKVHGWLTTPKAGTQAGYEYQVEKCEPLNSPRCQWTETAPPGRALLEHPEPRGVIVRFLELFTPPAARAADGDSIIWGS